MKSMITLKFLNSIVLVALALVLAAPVAAAGDIGATPTDFVPAPPRLADGSGSGVRGSEQANVGDYALVALLRAGAGVCDAVGLGDAAIFMRHYLDDSGTPLNMQPERLMRDMPAFRSQVEQDAKRFLASIQVALESGGRSGGSKVFTAQFDGSEWNGWYATKERSLDWYLAVGGFSYALTAVVEMPAEGNVADVTLVLHVYDRYDWDNGRGTRVAGLYVPNEALGRLHRAGLARDYEVAGDSVVERVEVRMGEGVIRK